MKARTLPRFYFMDNGAKLVSSAILGLDWKNVLVGGRVYTISPPTIKRIAGAGLWLSVDDHAFKDIGNVTKALSWFIQGDESLAEELSDGTMEEVVAALEVAVSMIGTQNFSKLSTLAKSVQRLIATPRP